MPEIYAEWICRKCKGKHRVKFPLIIGSTAYHTIKRKLWQKGEVKIDDPAYALKQGRQQSITKAKKYAVYVDTLTPISDIITALREYVQSYYTTEENTLKVDVCFES